MDFLSVFDGSSSAAPLLGHYSGAELPPPLTSSGRILRIQNNANTDQTPFGRSWLDHRTAALRRQFLSVQVQICTCCSRPMTTARLPGSERRSQSVASLWSTGSRRTSQRT